MAHAIDANAAAASGTGLSSADRNAIFANPTAPSGASPHLQPAPPVAWSPLHPGEAQAAPGSAKSERLRMQPHTLTLSASPSKAATLPDPATARIVVVGLGYVGLPLAVSFGCHQPTVGFDINATRVAELREQNDRTCEVSRDQLAAATHLHLSSSPSDLDRRHAFIVTVPTPIDDSKRPDLAPLESACVRIGRHLRRGAIVIFESTVYPGATEEICVPILARESGLAYNHDFFVGYSPERINPGDSEHRLDNIVKITAGSSPEAADFVDALYRRIVTAGTHRASSIRVAEAAKVIENTQRDLNIALINELALICERLQIDTSEVLTAAGTKWNFLPFRPGLVGGHCIGVDPYYLTHKAQQIGYHPEVILSGRRINDSMGGHVARRVIKLMIAKRIHAADARVLVLGFAFKANCRDLRNTRVLDVVNELTSYRVKVDICDPLVHADEARSEYALDLVEQPQPGAYDAIVLAVAHRDFIAMGLAQIRALGKPLCVIFDVTNTLPAQHVDGRL